MEKEKEQVLFEASSLTKEKIKTMTVQLKQKTYKG